MTESDTQPADGSYPAQTIRLDVSKKTVSPKSISLKSVSSPAEKDIHYFSRISFLGWVIKVKHFTYTHNIDYSINTICNTEA